MSEEHLIRHGAPTLAGIKTGSLFGCTYTEEAALRSALRALNRRLVPRGLRVIPLQFTNRRALLYLYRPGMLRRDLAQTQARKLLYKHGYPVCDAGKCIVYLIHRILSGDDFPHEIGLFLGYPVEDVEGFIDNKACCCKCVGYWKVYGDVAEAQKRFAQYKKCSRVYMDRWRSGSCLERLAVSS